MDTFLTLMILYLDTLKKSTKNYQKTIKKLSNFYQLFYIS
nr:MAG TPA: hypothetical protein [Caudoviricetes sp.]